MTIQRVLDEMQKHEYMQFVQFKYLQVTNINFKKLFVYSDCYAIFIYAYIIACKFLIFSTTIELMYFKLSGVKKIYLN